MESIGALIKKKRAEKGISLESISLRTKIKEDILICLEDDVDPDVGGEAYTRLMQITFLRAVGCEENEITALFGPDKDWQKINKTDKDSELFPSRVMFNKNMLLGALLGIIVIIMGIIVFNLHTSGHLLSPFRKTDEAKLTEEADIINYDEELHLEDFEFTPETDIIEEPSVQQNAEPLSITSEPSVVREQTVRVSPEDEPLTVDKEPEVAAASLSEDHILKVINDRTDYLSELFSINLDTIIPMKDETSDINTFIVNRGGN